MIPSPYTFHLLLVVWVVGWCADSAAAFRHILFVGRMKFVSLEVNLGVSWYLSYIVYPILLFSGSLSPCPNMTEILLMHGFLYKPQLNLSLLLQNNSSGLSSSFYTELYLGEPEF